MSIMPTKMVVQFLTQITEHSGVKLKEYQKGKRQKRTLVLKMLTFFQCSYFSVTSSYLVYHIQNSVLKINLPTYGN